MNLLKQFHAVVWVNLAVCTGTASRLPTPCNKYHMCAHVFMDFFWPVHPRKRTVLFDVRCAVPEPARALGASRVLQKPFTMVGYGMKYSEERKGTRSLNQPTYWQPDESLSERLSEALEQRSKLDYKVVQHRQ